MSYTEVSIGVSGKLQGLRLGEVKAVDHQQQQPAHQDRQGAEWDAEV